MSSSAEETTNQLPQHIAIIMDGNGRWASERGLPRLDGHKAGAESVRKVVEECCRIGVQHLTLFSFSTENWNRSQEEVGGLMKLFRTYLDSELHTMLKNDIRLRAVGDLERLPFVVRTALHRNLEQTKNCTAMQLVLAISYGGREEILHAAQTLAKRVKTGELAPEDITHDLFAKNLWTAEIPEPDLLIRTSNEMRISNFLLWQLAYAEIVVTPERWPDFNEETLHRCIDEYGSRERRYGLTSEQIKNRKLAS